MNPARVVPGIIGAIIGGLVGTAIWAAVVYFANIEAGLIAWGVGGLVGLGGLLLGARGMNMAIICGLIAALSIVGGKYVGLQLVFVTLFDDPEFRVAYRENYDEYLKDANLYGSVTDERSLRAFMVDRGYTEAESPDAVYAEEIEWFRDEMDPMLKEWAVSPPTYEQWFVESKAKFLSMARTTIPPWDVIKESVGFLDILFFFLGVSTAFQLVASRPHEE